MNYYYKKETALPFVQAVDKAKESLAKEGFGILTEIDVQATLKEKIGKEHDRYVILGACNPSFAYEALIAEKDIGLLLPCNVVVYEDKGKVFVSAVVPHVAMGFVQNKSLQPIAEAVGEKLRIVVDTL